MKLSNQAIGALMMALQKGVMEQTDITELLRDLELAETTEGLVVKNPPIIQVGEEDTSDEANA